MLCPSPSRSSDSIRRAVHRIYVFPCHTDTPARRTCAHNSGHSAPVFCGQRAAPLKIDFQPRMRACVKCVRAVRCAAKHQHIPPGGGANKKTCCSFCGLLHTHTHTCSYVSVGLCCGRDGGVIRLQYAGVHARCLWAIDNWLESRASERTASTREMEMIAIILDRAHIHMKRIK